MTHQHHETYTLGPDIDLDQEEVYLADGSRLTEARAEEIVEETLAEVRRGRRSLTGGGQHSPHMSFRVSDSLRAKAERRALAEGKRVSDVAREALEHHLR